MRGTQLNGCVGGCQKMLGHEKKGWLCIQLTFSLPLIPIILIPLWTLDMMLTMAEMLMIWKGQHEWLNLTRIMSIIKVITMAMKEDPHKVGSSLDALSRAATASLPGGLGNKQRQCCRKCSTNPRSSRSLAIRQPQKGISSYRSLILIPDPDPVAQAAPSILDIFPQDLLTSRLIMIYSLSPETDDCFLTHLRSRIKPLDIRRIEHDHFIDYEVGLVVDLVAAELAFPKVTFFPGRVRWAARRGEWGERKWQLGDQSLREWGSWPERRRRSIRG